MSEISKAEFHALPAAEKTAVWERLPEWHRAAIRDTSDLHPALVGLEGWRIECNGVDEWGLANPNGISRRFIVGRSTGWRPCHLILRRSDTRGGHAVSLHAPITIIRKIEKVR